MKKKLAVALAVVLVAGLSTPTMAHRYNRNNDGNPFRLIGYIAHPIGIALEYVVMRPVHALVSQPDLDIVFGHKAYLGDNEHYWDWSHGDYSPSIADQQPAGPAPAAKSDKK